MDEIKFEKVNKDIQVYPEDFKRKVVEEYLAAAAQKWICCVSMESKQKVVFKDG